ncbi:MAG: AAA family ATPase, partial [Planctomycetota bacterium]
RSETPAVAASRSEVRVDAKGTTAPQRRPQVDTSGELLTAALGELIGEIATAESEPDAAPSASASTSETWRSERLSRDLGFSERVVQDALEALATRGRVLLAGVVGTGKTYLARRIALHLAGRDERVVVLRMHPALGYDDLVEARRPDGQIERGIVRELCERARKEREARFALVLDDVDRGDLTRALGELAGAICERGVEIQLGRSRERVSSPKNLYVIATARSAPHELVGRFPAVEVEPDADSLRRFLARSHSALEWVADLLRETNVRLVRDRGPQARLGQAILMDPELDVHRLEGIWRREVLPFVRSLGLDSKDFELAALRK